MPTAQNDPDAGPAPIAYLPGAEPVAAPSGVDVDAAREAVAPPPAPAHQVDVDGAAAALLKRLRTRQLSSREARDVLVTCGVDVVSVEGVIADFEQRGYLDDARLAEQLVYAGSTRKGQGRRMIAQTLSARGIAREVAEAALDELPDDDIERALECARRKARSMGSLDREAALRRLHGQLARRGFSGSVAVSAAQRALDEAGLAPSGVHFR